MIIQNFLIRSAHEDPRAVEALMAYYSNHLDRACHLLMHPELWDIPGIMLYLQTTILPDKEFLRLPAEHLYAFFNNNDETRALFYQISENKRAHVLVHTYISMSNRF